MLHERQSLLYVRLSEQIFRHTMCYLSLELDTGDGRTTAPLMWELMVQSKVKIYPIVMTWRPLHDDTIISSPGTWPLTLHWLPGERRNVCSVKRITIVCFFPLTSCSSLQCLIQRFNYEGRCCLSNEKIQILNRQVKCPSFSKAASPTWLLLSKPRISLTSSGIESFRLPAWIPWTLNAIIASVNITDNSTISSLYYWPTEE